jgi:DNA replication protein DnaC
MKNNELRNVLKALKLSETLKNYEDIIRLSEQESLTYEDFLIELLRPEVENRRSNKIVRILKLSGLDLRKSMDTFELKRLDKRLRGQVQNILRGDFIQRKENVLAFGNPGSGKTHLLSGILQELGKQGHRILFRTCERLVEELLIQKRELILSAYLKKLDNFKVILIDDIGYVQKSKEEMEVLFSLLAHRYERGAVMITSNLVFSQWEQIFKDPMTTAAVVDRMVHHSFILELNLPSYRAEEAKKSRAKKPTEDG